MLSENAKQQRLYGLWSSPLTPEIVSRRIRLEDVQWDSDGRTLVWMEGRSGHNVLVARREGEAAHDLTDAEMVRGGIGYGGGDFSVTNGRVIFATRQGPLMQRGLEYGSSTALTPAFGGVASPALSPDGEWIVYVFSDGQTDLLGLVDARGERWPLKLVQGADFYMQPVWHPGGRHLAWVEWNNPYMPWEASRLMVGRVEGSPLRMVEPTLVAGEFGMPVSQPHFSPDGRCLSYVARHGEWECLVLRDFASGQERILVEGDSFLLSLPAWVQGMRSYGWSSDGRRIFSIRNYAGLATLWVVDVESGRSTQIPTGPYQWVSQLAVSPVEDHLAFVASAANVPDRVVYWDGAALRVVARSVSETFPPGVLAVPQDITWKAPDGTDVHGLFYAPTNPDFTCGGLPPAIVNVHGGPTGQATRAYAPDIAYFTSRGYAWLEVNHRGSTGYGYLYRDAMYRRWGEVDTEDAVGGARALEEQGLANGKRLVIYGGSAGGYTVLNALIQAPGCFKAGVCLYGVSNLFTLDLETHKFEACYNDSLIGPLPEATDHYYARSPVFHADRICDPLAIFQGGQDRVVPPSQSEEIVRVLQKNHVPYLYHLYEEEGHGFRKRETIADFLAQMEYFLRQHVLFAP